MGKPIKKYFQNVVEDVILVPFVYIAAVLLKAVRRMGVHRLRLCKSALMHAGVFPVRDHYYEPQFDHRNPNPDFSEDRKLPGIDWNVPAQLAMLERFTFSDELSDIPQDLPKPRDPLVFFMNNGGFESGDAECWYQIIRTIKPRRIFEVGSGNSTLMAIKAIQKNQQESRKYQCNHVCIEPYETSWLEKTGVSVIRKKVEDVEMSFFSELQENDILFIDSSHVIRPQGDVLCEFLQILPSLNKGVIVHVHDIFSPKNYPEVWLRDMVKFFNEQYLLEAFLSHNNSWEIVGALNYLHHKHYDELKAAAPFLTPDREPGSFYMRKIT